MRNFQRIFINEKREKENNYDNNFEEKNINEKKMHKSDNDKEIIKDKVR